MKQATLKLKNYAGSVSIVNNSNLKRRVLNIMLWSLGALGLCYVLLLGNMVFSIVARRSFEADARVLSNQVGDLELVYLSMSGKVDPALAVSMGFRETKIKFATRKSLGYSTAGEFIGSIKMPQNEL